MDNDLLLPMFWTLVFGSLLTFGVRRLTKKLPIKKRWVRPETEAKADKKDS